MLIIHYLVFSASYQWLQHVYQALRAAFDPMFDDLLTTAIMATIAILHQLLG